MSHNSCCIFIKLWKVITSKQVTLEVGEPFSRGSKNDTQVYRIFLVKGHLNGKFNQWLPWNSPYVQLTWFEIFIQKNKKYWLYSFSTEDQKDYSNPTHATLAMPLHNCFAAIFSLTTPLREGRYFMYDNIHFNINFTFVRHCRLAKG